MRLLKKIERFLFIVPSFLFVTQYLFASETHPIQQIEKKVVEETLKNGLKVLILERTIAPIVSFQMMFKVGSVDEVSGKRGLAHLFEHMMFKGSQTVGTKNYHKEKSILEKIDQVAGEILKEESKESSSNKEKINLLKEKLKALEKEHQRWIVPAEFEEIYQREGGEGLNAFTGMDMTGFVISLPSNKWELWPVMESDRMVHPVLREFYKERDVVMEERRMRYENNPNGKIWEDFLAAAFMAHPYGSPTIGWMSDIKQLTLSDAKNFFRAHYVPQNCVVAIVGDVRPKEVIKKLENYFAKVPVRPVSPLSPNVVTKEPQQSGERRISLHFDSEPFLLMGFHKPNPPHPDNFAMDMIEQILSRGRTARFHKNIIEKKIAVSLWGSNGNPGERYPNLIVFGGLPQRPKTNLDLERAICEELEKLKKEKVPEIELEKVRNQIEADFIRQLNSNSGMASQLVYSQTVLGDWRYPARYLEEIKKVTPDDIQRAANRYFRKDNQTIALLEREKNEGNR